MKMKNGMISGQDVILKKERNEKLHNQWTIQHYTFKKERRKEI